MTHDVIVIGGGLAGVIAARETVRTGRSVLLLEARDRLGGRTWYKRDALAGRSLEMGGAWIDPSHELVQAEVRRYGLTASQPWPFTLPDAWLLGGRRRAERLPVPAEDVPGFENFLVAVRAAAARIDPDLPLEEQRLEELDVSFDEFLDGLGLAPAVREIASVGLGSVYGDDRSALNLLKRVAVVGSLSGYLASTASQVIEQGTTALVDAIAHDSGADVVVGSPVRRVEQDAAGVAVHTDGERHGARAAVVALPLSVLAHLDFEPSLDPAKASVSQEGAGWAGVKVWAIVRGVEPGFSSLGLAHGLDFVAALEPVEGGTLIVCFGPRAAEVDCADRAAIERAVRAHLPGAEVVACAGHDWTTDPWSRGAWTAYRPGQVTRHGRALRRGEGRLVFAGADVAVRSPGNIEGALETGFRAAAEVGALLEGQ